MAIDINFISSVTERDIDLLVLEELSVNVEFQDWFVTRTIGPKSFSELLGAWHSVSDVTLGETDIQFLYLSEEGQRIALLIENKISAPPQPEQGSRYKQRGEKGIAEGYWEEFCTVAIAPARYLASTQHSESYDQEISYEELLAFFSSRRSRDPRFAYRASLILEAVEQNRRGYQPKQDEHMTNFVAAYYETYNKSLPQLSMQEPKPRPAQSDWVVFTPKDYPKDIWLCHQLFPGKVKVMFTEGASRLEELGERYSSVLSGDIKLGPAGKSAAISICVPQIRPSAGGFEVHRESVAVAVAAVQRLDAIVREIECI